MNYQIIKDDDCRSKDKIHFDILSGNDDFIGYAEGEVAGNMLHLDIMISPECREKGIGTEVVLKIHEELSKDNDIIGIASCWTKDEGKTTNLLSYKENIDKSASQEESALNTPTGKWAKRLGYCKCRITSDSSYSVKVDFYKDEDSYQEVAF